MMAPSFRFEDSEGDSSCQTRHHAEQIAPPVSHELQRSAEGAGTWRRKADDWCTSRVSGRSILLAANCGPVELPSRSAVARSTLSKFWFARPASSSPSTISRVAYGWARLSKTLHFNFTYRQFARRSARIVNS